MCGVNIVEVIMVEVGVEVEVEVDVEVLVVDMKDEDKVQNFQLLCKVQFGF